jgi:hypothetical protein
MLNEWQIFARQNAIASNPKALDFRAPRLIGFLAG